METSISISKDDENLLKVLEHVKQKNNWTEEFAKDVLGEYILLLGLKMVYSDISLESVCNNIRMLWEMHIFTDYYYIYCINKFGKSIPCKNLLTLMKTPTISDTIKLFREFYSSDINTEIWEWYECPICFTEKEIGDSNFINFECCNTLICNKCFTKIDKCPMCRAEKPYCFNIKTLTGEEFSIKCEQNVLVKHLKYKIYVLKNYCYGNPPPFLYEKSKLIYNRNHLDNNKTIGEYNIKYGDTVCFVLYA